MALSILVNFLATKIHYGIFFPKPLCDMMISTTGFNVPHFFMPRMAEDISFTEDIFYLESALSRKNFNEIIESSELFWMAFCKAFSQIEGEDSSFFSTSLHEKTLTISGKKHIILKFQKFLEEIRKLFVKAHNERKDFFILPIMIASTCFIKEKIDLIDLTDWLSDRHVELSKHWVEGFVRPSMQSFCESIGVVCSNVVVSQKIITDNNSVVHNRNIKAFRINWISGKHFVYPIEPKTIPPRNDIQKSMYSMYKNKILCDFSLIARDGIVQVHSIFLFTYGGGMIQKMLTSNMEESLEKRVYFSEFSLNSVEAFVDFAYLGEKGLQPESVLKRDLDVYELFQMAHTYQVQPLIDCCTNLLSLFSSAEDIEKIKYLAEFYENEHLKELHENLLLKLNPSQNFIKV